MNKFLGSLILTMLSLDLSAASLKEYTAQLENLILTERYAEAIELYDGRTELPKGSYIHIMTDKKSGYVFFTSEYMSWLKKTDTKHTILKDAIENPSSYDIDEFDITFGEETRRKFLSDIENNQLFYRISRLPSDRLSTINMASSSRDRIVFSVKAREHINLINAKYVKLYKDAAAAISTFKDSWTKKGDLFKNINKSDDYNSVIDKLMCMAADKYVKRGTNDYSEAHQSSVREQMQNTPWQERLVAIGEKWKNEDLFSVLKQSLRKEWIDIYKIDYVTPGFKCELLCMDAPINGGLYQASVYFVSSMSEQLLGIIATKAGVQGEKTTTTQRQETFFTGLYLTYSESTDQSVNPNTQIAYSLSSYGDFKLELNKPEAQGSIVDGHSMDGRLHSVKKYLNIDPELDAILVLDAVVDFFNQGTIKEKTLLTKKFLYYGRQLAPRTFDLTLHSENCKYKVIDLNKVWLLDRYKATIMDTLEKAGAEVDEASKNKNIDDL